MAFDETSAQLMRDNRELKVQAETLAGLLKRCARCLPPDHTTRKLATEYLRQHGFLSPLRANGVIAAPAPHWPVGLLDRVKAAEQRIQDNHAPRRIPADPHGDVDLVLAEVRYLIEGRWPPFWIKDADGVGVVDHQTKAAQPPME